MSKVTKQDEIPVSDGFSNVFEALGFEGSEEMLAKAQLAHTISSIIRHRHLTQKEAAEVLGTTQPKVSALMNGRLSGLSMERLVALVNRLDRDVEIRISKKPRNHDAGRLSVRVA